MKQPRERHVRSDHSFGELPLAEMDECPLRAGARRVPLGALRVTGGPEVIRHLWRSCAAAISALTLIGCGSSHADRDAQTELRVALPGDIRSTNPGVMRDGNTDTVIHHIVESLVAYRSDLTVAPHLAERIEVSNDGASYTFHLRRGVRFHNGAVMTSREVLWSWRRMLDPQTRWRCRHWYDGSSPKGVKILSIEAPEAYRVEFRLERPDPLFLDRMANVQCVTAILHPDSLDEQGQWRSPVGTGPYVLHEWVPGKEIVLQRFAQYTPRAEPRDGYAGARIAKTEFVRFSIMQDAAAGVAAIISGDLDLMPRIPPHLAQELARTPGLRTYDQDLLYWSVLLINGTDPLLKDPRMRRAIAHAIDPGQIAAISTFGKAKANVSAVPRLSPYRTAVHDRWWPYDPQKAKELLKLTAYHGQEIRIQANRKYPAMFDNAVAVQAMLVAVGIDARLEVLDWATQLSDYFSNEFQLSSFDYSGRTHPVLNYGTILGDRETKRTTQWENETAQRLLDKAESTHDVQLQMALFEQIHLLMMQDAPLIGLYNEHAIDAARANIEGFEPWPLANLRLWGVWKKAG